MAAGIQTQYLDLTTSPAEDFYQFVNGGWLSQTRIPPDRGSWGSFHELNKQTDDDVLALLREALATPGPDPNLAARLYETAMDTRSIDQAGISPLEPWLSEIRSTPAHAALPGLIGRLNAIGMDALLSFSVGPDMADSRRYTGYLEAPPLGLPERDYYLSDDEKSASIREAYRHYIHRILTRELRMSGAEAEEASHAVLHLETELARHMIPKEERRQVEKLYNPFTADQLAEAHPEWDWQAYWNAMVPTPITRVIVTEPAYLQFLFSRLAAFPLSHIRYYLSFTLVHRSASFAHAALETDRFELMEKKLQGIEQMRPREERVVKVVNQSLGESLGQLYVARHFPARAKEQALEMVGDIIAAFRQRISTLTWMSEETKAYALEKLASFRVKIGYPDQWETYPGLTLQSAEEGGTYLGSMLAVAAWRWQRDAGRIDQPVDREEWFMAPQVVNAYYHPLLNEIVFPAAILQPPFFDWQADAAVNYGGIGAVIGHEITHGFDDQGSRFDKTGNLHEWWSEQDRTRFQTLTARLIEQADSYFPLDDLPVNGTYTLGENIADLGGLSVAYDALQLYYARHGRPAPIDGFTPEQRFFMSWATVWRTQIRPEALRTQILTDPHPPGMYRAVAAPSNLDSFYSAFSVAPGSPLYRKPDERVRIW